MMLPHVAVTLGEWLSEEPQRTWDWAFIRGEGINPERVRVELNTNMTRDPSDPGSIAATGEGVDLGAAVEDALRKVGKLS